MLLNELHHHEFSAKTSLSSDIQLGTKTLIALGVRSNASSHSPLTS